MINILTVAFSIVFAASPVNAITVNDNFDPATLSGRGREAYTSLLKASQFEDARVGYAGVVSRYAKDLETLLNEEHGDAAFKSLLKNATTPGRLYGLCGIFYTDNEMFRKKIEEYRGSEERIGMASGCEIYEASVSEIIESKGKNVAIIGPTESLEQFLAGSVGQGYNIDIANGGYQATFRHSVKQEIGRAK